MLVVIVSLSKTLVSFMLFKGGLIKLKYDNIHVSNEGKILEERNRLVRFGRFKSLFTFFSLREVITNEFEAI